MAGIFDAFKTAWREYVVDGVPSSGKQNPHKPDIWPIGELLDTQIDEVRTIALAGARSPVTVRVIATANVAISNGLENGDTVDGVVLATGDVVVLAGQTDPIQNGAYVVVASGAASRDPRYDSGNELVGAQFAAAAGSNTGWVYAVRGNPVIGTGPISITRAYETAAQPDGSVTPPKLAPQTPNGLLGYNGAGQGAVIDPLTLPISTLAQEAVTAEANKRAQGDHGLQTAVAEGLDGMRTYRGDSTIKPIAVNRDGAIGFGINEPDASLHVGLPLSGPGKVALDADMLAAVAGQDYLQEALAYNAFGSPTVDSSFWTADLTKHPNRLFPNPYRDQKRDTYQADAVLYGANFGAICAAYQLRRAGFRPLIVGGWRERSLGGMIAGGLGGTDIRALAAYGGLPLDVLHRINALAGASPNFIGQQPRYAELVARQMVREANIPVVWTRGVTTVNKTGTTITSIETLDGKVFEARLFADFSYEGDLQRLTPGVETIVGREARSANNPLSGFRGELTTDGGDKHQWLSGGEYVDPFVVPGDPGSGLLPGVTARPATAVGASDNRQQAYNYRMVMTRADRKVALPTTAPAGWTALHSELLCRYFAAKEANYGAYGSNWNFNNSLILPFLLYNRDENPANTLTRIHDNNNFGPFSLDLLGGSQGYIEADYVAREAFVTAHRNHILGFFWTAQHFSDPRVPAGLRTHAREWGLDRMHFPAEHFGDMAHWPYSLYVREGARLVGDFVLNGLDVAAADGSTPRSAKTVAGGTYERDRHHNQRYAVQIGGVWRVWNEGNVYGAGGGADGVFPVPMECLFPKLTECTNLVSGFNISSSMEAFGAFRMEFTLMAAGQAIGEIFAMTLEQSVPYAVQATPYAPLRARLLASPDTTPPALPQVN